MTDQRSLVFVPMKTTHDVSSARSYGKIQTLLAEDSVISPFSTDELIRELKNGLQKYRFDAERDYLVASGSIPHLVIAAAIIAAEYGRLRLLIFDARSDKYRARDLVFSGEELPV